MLIVISAARARTLYMITLTSTYSGTPVVLHSASQSVSTEEVLIQSDKSCSKELELDCIDNSAEEDNTVPCIKDTGVYVMPECINGAFEKFIQTYHRGGGGAFRGSKLPPPPESSKRVPKILKDANKTVRKFGMDGVWLRPCI